MLTKFCTPAQPETERNVKSMAKDIQLTYYQVFGINKSSLLLHRKLSCILANDIGLGEIFQVIAILAHVKEKGIKGPRLYSFNTAALS